MATFQTISDRALRLLGHLVSGASGTVAETADNLTACNALLDSCRNERLMCYAIQDESITLSAGNTTRTIGPTGNLVSTRPVRIDEAYVVYSNISSPVRILNENEYAAIPDKTTTGTYPNRIWYQPSVTNGTIYMYPLPSASSVLHVLTWTPFTAFSAASDTVTLPPGWEDFLACNLAVYIAPEYEEAVSPDLRKMATDTKANIKRINARPIKAYSDLPALLGGGARDIITDGP